MEEQGQDGREPGEELFREVMPELRGSDHDEKV